MTTPTGIELCVGVFANLGSQEISAHLDRECPVGSSIGANLGKFVFGASHYTNPRCEWYISRLLFVEKGKLAMTP